jgi:hypothetical protein
VCGSLRRSLTCSVRDFFSPLFIFALTFSLFLSSFRRACVCVFRQVCVCACVRACVWQVAVLRHSLLHCTHAHALSHLRLLLGLRLLLLGLRHGGRLLVGRLLNKPQNKLRRAHRQRLQRRSQQVQARLVFVVLQARAQAGRFEDARA